jgi:hypothetical protein
VHAPRTIRRIGKWTCLALTIAIIVLWLASTRWLMVGSFGKSSMRLFVWPGSISIVRWEIPITRPGWHIWGDNPTYPTKWTPSMRGSTAGRFELLLPMWMPLLLTAGASAWLFWQDRRRYLPGHCRACGYNLTGNTSGKCSECGEPIVAAQPPLSPPSSPAAAPSTSSDSSV